MIRDRGARSVLDFGCGDGDLLVRIAAEEDLDSIVGVDVCNLSLSRLNARLEGESVSRDLVKLLHASLLDAPSWLQGFDCAVLVETIEHLDAERLGAFENSVLGRLRPDTVVVTTPNAEYNALLGVPAHRFRHPDHRFEWDRARFRHWADGVARRQGYRVICTDIAGQHPTLGGASQMAAFDVCQDASDRHAA